MSQVSLDLFSALSPMEPAVSAAPPRRAKEDAFGEHLARAQSETDAPDVDGSTAAEPRGETGPAKPEPAPPEAQPADSAEENEAPVDNPEEPAKSVPTVAHGKASEKAEETDAEAVDEGSQPADDEEQEVAASADPPVVQAVVQTVISVETPGAKKAQKSPAGAATKQASHVAEAKNTASSDSSAADVQADAAKTPAKSALPEVAGETSAKAATGPENQPPSPAPARERKPRAAQPSPHDPLADEGQQAPEGKGGASKADALSAESQTQPAADSAQTTLEPAPTMALPAVPETKTADSAATAERRKSDAPARAESPESIEPKRATLPDAALAVVVPRAPDVLSAELPGTDEHKPEPSDLVATSKQASTDTVTPQPTDPAVSNTAVSKVDNTAASASGVNGTAGPAQDDKTEQGRQAERVRFAQRVSRAFEAVGERNGSLRLKLSPPELGSLRLEIAVQQGVLSARLEAETPAARNLLLESLPALRDRLAQQDIRIERFDVELMDRRPGGNAEQPGGQAESNRQSPERSAIRRESRVDTVASVPGESRAISLGPEANHLNIII